MLLALLQPKWPCQEKAFILQLKVCSSAAASKHQLQAHG